MALVTCGVSAAEITYEIINPVSLSSGYTLNGGFITTNGTLGPIGEEDILDYEVRVDGPIPYVFRPTNPISFPIELIRVAGLVNATATAIEIPPEQMLPLNMNALTFGAVDDVWPGCNSSCVESIQFENSSDGRRSVSAVEYVVQNGIFDEGLMNIFQEPPVVFVIATVPEPSSVMLSLFSMGIGALVARKRNARTE